MANDMDVVLSSRVRLARNLDAVAFPARLTPQQAESVIGRVEGAINGGKDFGLMRMRELGPGERKLLLEKHLASADLIGSGMAALLLSKDETLSIMLNEEDHLRIQCILPGLSLEKADELTRALDETLAKSLPYAFDPRLGYLTSCPTNVGTGLRASVMMHLPGLNITGYLGGILKGLSKLGYAVRGYYGEGSATPGNIFQVSNQVTLGVSEEEIIHNLQASIRQVIVKEREVTELIKGKSMDLEDRICRSYGQLLHARLLSFDELMEKISDVKLGVNLGLFHIGHALLHELIAAQPYNTGNLSKNELDAARARMVREALTRDINDISDINTR